jgi:hypothetical protein
MWVMSVARSDCQFEYLSRSYTAHLMAHRYKRVQMVSCEAACQVSRNTYQGCNKPGRGGFSTNR